MVWAVLGSSMYAYCTRSVSNAGGIFVNRGFEEAVTDGNLVTGPAWTLDHSAVQAVTACRYLRLSCC
jgi:hypothetical protein